MAAPEVQYEATVIRQFAQRLYRQASSTVAGYVFLGLLVGAGSGLSLSGNSGTAALIGALVVGAIGFVLGQKAAFALRLQAQTALCQVQIELNTRPGGPAAQLAGTRGD